MIYLTRINQSKLILNSDLIENIQSTPDTVITLTSGRNYLVLETPDEIVDLIVNFRHRIAARNAALGVTRIVPMNNAHAEPLS